MNLSEIRKTTYCCSRCNTEYSIRNFSDDRILKSFDTLSTLCTDCRKYKICPICKTEFKHHQNQTCSKKCSNELKQQSFLKSEGVSHNFKRGSKTRDLMEARLLAEHGVTNQFAVENTKFKIRKTILAKYGVDNISKAESIKRQKLETFNSTLVKDPQLFKRSWQKSHSKFIDELGYDPRLRGLPQTSNESIEFFSPILKLLNDNGIKFFCGIDGCREFCIRDKSIGKSYFYDLVIPKLKLVIEYNNCAWHAKTKDQEWIHPITKQTASDNFEYFNQKLELIKQYNYTAFVVWTDEDKLTQLNNLTNLISNLIYENKKNN